MNNLDLFKIPMTVNSSSKNSKSNESNELSYKSNSMRSSLGCIIFIACIPNGVGSTSWSLISGPKSMPMGTPVTSSKSLLWERRGTPHQDRGTSSHGACLAWTVVPLPSPTHKTKMDVLHGRYVFTQENYFGNETDETFTY